MISSVERIFLWILLMIVLILSIWALVYAYTNNNDNVSKKGDIGPQGVQGDIGETGTAGILESWEIIDTDFDQQATNLANGSLSTLSSKIASCDMSFYITTAFAGGLNGYTFATHQLYPQMTKPLYFSCFVNGTVMGTITFRIADNNVTLHLPDGTYPAGTTLIQVYGCASIV